MGYRWKVGVELELGSRRTYDWVPLAWLFNIGSSIVLLMSRMGL
jgi:hypothetical protein